MKQQRKTKLSKEQRKEVEALIGRQRQNASIVPPKNRANVGSRARRGKREEGSCMSPICKSVCDNLTSGASSIFLPTSSYSWEGNNAEHRIPHSELFGITYSSRKTLYGTKGGSTSSTIWLMVCLQQVGGQRAVVYRTNGSWVTLGTDVPGIAATGVVAVTAGMDEPYDGSTLSTDVYTFLRSFAVKVQLNTEATLSREGKIITFMTHRPPAGMTSAQYEALPSYASYSASILNPASRVIVKPPLRNSGYIGAKTSTGYDWLVVGITGVPTAAQPEFGFTIQYEAAIVGNSVPPSVAFQVAAEEWDMAAGAHSAAMGPTFSYLAAEAGQRGEEYRKQIVAAATSSIPSFVAKASAEQVKPDEGGWIKSVTDGLSVLEIGARTLASIATL